MAPGTLLQLVRVVSPGFSRSLRFPFHHHIVLLVPASFCSRHCPPASFPPPQSQAGAYAASLWTLFQKRWHLVRSLLVLRHFIAGPFWLHAVLAARLEPGFTASSSLAIKRGIAEMPLQKGVSVKSVTKRKQQGDFTPCSCCILGFAPCLGHM